MVQSYLLMLQDVPILDHDIVGIYPFRDKIVITHFETGYSTQEKFEKEKCLPSYALLDTFSMDFKVRRQTYLSYYEQQTFSANDAVCYWENDCFLMNTYRWYNDFSKPIAKIMQITDTSLLEIGDAPAPSQIVVNDQKTYIFGNHEVKMASCFIMECRDTASKNVRWKLKLSAYLYTEIEEQNGILYFGTAGKGGRFYGVHLENGSVIFSYYTGGTEQFKWYKGEVLLADRKNKPVLVNPLTGIESRKVEFGKFAFTVDQFMLVISDKLYAVASRKNEMYAVCADLNAP